MTSARLAASPAVERRAELGADAADRVAHQAARRPWSCRAPRRRSGARSRRSSSSGRSAGGRRHDRFLQRDRVRDRRCPAPSAPAAGRGPPSRWTCGSAATTSPARAAGCPAAPGSSIAFDAAGSLMNASVSSARRRSASDSFGDRARADRSGTAAGTCSRHAIQRERRRPRERIALTPERRGAAGRRAPAPCRSRRCPALRGSCDPCPSKPRAMSTRMSSAAAAGWSRIDSATSRRTPGSVSRASVAATGRTSRSARRIAR